MKKNGSFEFVPLCKIEPAAQLAAFNNNLLVIAPHPDDDVIGMGGTMRLSADAGARVFTAYVTHGRTQSASAALRRSEALAALKTVRASGAFFLNYASSALAGSSRGAARQLRSIIGLLRPAEIYLPSPFERHPTHRLVTRIAQGAVKDLQHPVPPLWGYSVWGGVYGLPGTKTVDISKYLQLKKRAIRQHASQTAEKPYDRGMLGRNIYEGIFLETHGGYVPAAETFINIGLLRKFNRLNLFLRHSGEGG